MPELKQAHVYQLKVWLLGISPMIWRRLLVRSDSTIADLHYKSTTQIRAEMHAKEILKLGSV